MNPLELEMYHQIKNVIGVNPSFYEYLLMVDADTTVHPLSVNRLISAQVIPFIIGRRNLTYLYSMIHDKKVLGVCGETELSNAKQSIITMMQVCISLFIKIDMANRNFRFTNTLFRTIWQKLSKVSSAQLLVFLVALRSIASGLRTPTNRY